MVNMNEAFIGSGCLLSQSLSELKVRNAVGLFLAIILVTLGTASCGGSGGETVSEQPSFVVDSVPLVRVTDQTGEIFQIVSSGTRLGDGTIVAVDQYAAKLHFFAPDGTYLYSKGRRGEGPGEFNDIRWVGHCATDSLYVWDYMARRILVFDPTGEFEREYRPEGSANEFSCSPNGHFGAIGFPLGPVPIAVQKERTPSPAWVTDRSGQILDTIPHVPFMENRVLGKETRIAVSDDFLFVGTADSAWVQVFDFNGDKIRDIPLGVDGRAPDQANYEASLEKILAVAPDREIREHFRSLYEAVPMPESMPPYFDLFTDPDGILWAVVSAPGDPVTVLDAVKASGESLGRLTLPRRLRVFEVGTDYILGRARGEADLPELVLYHFSRTRVE